MKIDNTAVKDTSYIDRTEMRSHAGIVIVWVAI